ncbi:hypothetical protein HNQ07_004440 [Deinococcus metalli]|uniref:Uncharacterized protein n=1 Tax=Deinococcus metalli TaxID=1141878 RepID=A0A7W8NTB4_9DEIO|nr:hypothetical protein [Deinococcus metalli]MBB5378933.1 hypothetical protein [Deinococcus metalli]GHF62848.1 hypothetical protein GCM10017781_43600 [Deinococcus metalli]
MVQTALDILQQALHALSGLARPAGVLLLILLVAGLLLGVLDPARSRVRRRWLGRRISDVGRWALVLAAVGAGTVLLRISRHAVDARLGAQQSARYATAADPDGGQTVQPAPRVSVLDTRTYTRTLTLPPDLYARVRAQGGWEALLPYLGQPDGGSLQTLREDFTRRGDRVEYTRAVTQPTEEPVNLDSSGIVTALTFVEPAGGRGQYYNAAFTADYTFTNPRRTPATLRFVFPLPSGSGTLNAFRMTVNGEVRRAAPDRDPTWEGTVPAGGVVKVNVTYRNQGARSWRYDLAQRREAIRAFSLRVTTNRTAKFQRYTLFPTRQGRSALGAVTHLEWSYQDIITAQDIALVFAQGSVRETLTKIAVFQLPALLLAALLCSAWAWSRRMALPPLALAAAVAGLALGFTLAGVLTAYLPVVVAQIVGTLAGVALATSRLGRAYVGPLALAGLTPLVFLSDGHAGLLLTLLGALLLLLFRPPVLARQWPALR